MLLNNNTDKFRTFLTVYTHNVFPYALVSANFYVWDPQLIFLATPIMPILAGVGVGGFHVDGSRVQ